MINVTDAKLITLSLNVYYFETKHKGSSSEEIKELFNILKSLSLIILHVPDCHSHLNQYYLKTYLQYITSGKAGTMYFFFAGMVNCTAFSTCLTFRCSSAKSYECWKISLIYQAVESCTKSNEVMHIYNSAIVVSPSTVKV